ncbi:MAG: hypothetical protein SEPTF4163_000630 [Sporothrix epigloea]
MDCDDPALPKISFGFLSNVPVDLDTSLVAVSRGAAQKGNNFINTKAEAEVAEDEVATEDEEAAADVDMVTPIVPPPLSILASVSGPSADHLVPDTLSWDPYGMPVRNEAPVSMSSSIQTTHNHPGPPLPKQPPPSVATTTSFSSQSHYMRPFAGRGLQTLTQVQHEPAPALSGSSLRALPGKKAATSSFRALEPGSIHMTRLNKPENRSFCASTISIPASSVVTQNHEECIERYDHMDMRVTELESRLGEVERYQSRNDNDTSTVVTGSIMSASTSEASLSRIASAACCTPSAAMTTDPCVLSELRALQEHVSLLQQAALPTPSQPWLIEVVYLPFPLKGIWVEAGQFGPSEAVASAAAVQRRQRWATPTSVDYDGEDEWKQMAELPETPWLLPRACVPDRDIDRRLRSRGLVQKVSVRGPDAHSLHMAMVAAFGSLLRLMSSKNATAASKDPGRSSSISLVSQFLGLQQSWVPLRKVHKESRLRLLKRSEMLTPALWNANFIKASVIMKATGLHRLFVTQPGAYLQNRDAYTSACSWQKLRELPQVHAELETGARGVGDACWAWNSRLDEPPETSPSEFTSSVSPSPPLSGRNLRSFSSHLSCDDTSTGHTRLHKASYPLAMTAAAATSAVVPTRAGPTGRSRLASIGASASSEQFFTVAQSPMHQCLQRQHLQQTAPGHTEAVASISLRQSLSPFFSSSSPSAPRRIPPPIRTTSMPPPHLASTTTIRGATPSATSGRRIHSTGSECVLAAAPTAPPLFAGISKRNLRRCTRSPSFGGIWHRNTPGPSRSRSVTPAIRRPSKARMEEAAEERSLEQAMHFQYQAGPQRARGTTPFAYATPFSTGTDHIASKSTSSKASGSVRRKRQPQERQSRQEQQKQQVQNRRESRYGSRGPIISVLGHANHRKSHIDGEDILMHGDGIDYYDDYDESDDLDVNFPTTQDEDDEDEEDEDEDDDDIEVYEDEQDMLGLSSKDIYYHSRPQLHYESVRQLLPKDQPQPGIEFDGDGDGEGDENDEGDDELDDGDSNNFIGHAGARHQYGRTRSRHDEEDEGMSDTENMNPLPTLLYGDQNDNYYMQPLQQSPTEPQDGEEHHSDYSSQPSEYPSTRGPWRWRSEERKRIKDEAEFGFKIHEDGDALNL